MSRVTPRIAAVLAVLVLSAGPALACYDNSDAFIDRLAALDLNKDQLDKIFALKEAQKGLIASCHQEGKSCAVHEEGEKAFEAAAVGWLDDAQFEKMNGRARTEAESLRRENQILKDEIAELRKEIAELKAAKAEANEAPAAPAAPAPEAKAAPEAAAPAEK